MTTKEKILEVSKSLFFNLGYDKTSIQKIIDGVGIAKGTFYHHFKSKEDLLDVLTDDITSKEIDKTLDYVKTSSDDAITKFNNFINMQTEWKSHQFDILLVILKGYYCDENLNFREMIKRKNEEKYSPYIGGIIKQGNEEGVFNAPYPMELARMMMKLTSDASDEIADVFLNYKKYENPYEVIMNKYGIMIYMVERIIGAKSGSIKIEYGDIINDFLKFLEDKEVNDD